MGKHAHNCITQFFESRRDTLAQGGPLCKRGGCVRTLCTPPAYGLDVLLNFFGNVTEFPDNIMKYTIGMGRSCGGYGIGMGRSCGGYV